MRNIFFAIICLAIIFPLSITSCKKTEIRSISSADYVGSYSGGQTCSLTGVDTMSIAITQNGALGINISNLYGSGKSFYASIDSLSGTIAAQNFTAGSSGNAVLQGTLLLSSNHDSLFLSLIVTSFSQRNTCSAVFIR